MRTELLVGIFTPVLQLRNILLSDFVPEEDLLLQQLVLLFEVVDLALKLQQCGLSNEQLPRAVLRLAASPICPAWQHRIDPWRAKSTIQAPAASMGQ